MKVRVMSAVMLMMMGMTSAFANVIIYDDLGGQIGEYLAKYLRFGMHNAIGHHSAEPDLCYDTGNS
jgi:hypothetical protein